MSSSSAEVAADFKDALQDLKVNSRPEISNLTIIAKENTEHAQAISQELENHIKTTRPEWKLPALYVLDSIVKNVGTPYTVYLGRNLYRTFMDAYLVMDPGNRRAMDGLLRTWKQPVPESMDPRPVFQPEVTRDIENALLKIKTVAVQQQQALPQRPGLPHGLPPRPPTNPTSNGPWRDTPTPPQNMPRYAAPNDPRIRQSYTPTPQYAQYSTPMPSLPPAQFPPVQFPTAQSFPPQSPTIDLESMKTDVAKLIGTTQTEWALKPSDSSIQQKLKALLGLETILRTQTIPPQQLQAVQAQIRALSIPPAPQQSFTLPASVPPPVIQSPQQAAAPTFPPPASTPVNLAQILANARAAVPHSATPTNPTPSLADMLRRVSSPVQPSSTSAAVQPFFSSFAAPPQPPPSATPVPNPTPPPTANLAQLLAQVSKQVPLPATSQPPPLPQFPPQQTAPTPAPGSAEWLLSALKGLPIPPASGTPSQSTPLASQPMTRQVSATTTAQSHVELSTASMKQPRLHLISRLYEAHPNICTTCGRRFENTPQGREKKARHMDWHFKVKDPDAAKRGVHRSWYIGEKEWIEYHEVDETSPEQGVNGAQGATPGPKKEAKDKYVPVPSDNVLAQAPCPICQEKFETNWHVEANDFVFMDAVKVNGKIYHATCWEEYGKGAGIATPSTPDSVLGKRKAEVGSPASGKKIRAY